MKYILYCLLVSAYSCSVLADTITITSKKELDALKAAGKPLVLKFYADWCGPCKMAKPPFEEVSNQPQFKHITFIEINSDKVPALTNEYKIDGIPAFIFMEGSKIKSKQTGLLGAMDTDGFKKKLKSALNRYFPTGAEPKEAIEEQESWFNTMVNSVKQFFLAVQQKIASWFS